MTNVNPEVIDQLNALARRRFDLQVEANEEEAQYKAQSRALEAAFTKRQAAHHSEMQQIDHEIWETIQQNRGNLIDPDRKSFATMVAKFFLKTVPARTAVIDKKGLLAVARRLRIMRKVASVKVAWDLDVKKFISWLQKNGEYRQEFEPFIEDIGENETLTMGPNANFTVFHNSKRISPPSIKIDHPSTS